MNDSIIKNSTPVSLYQPPPDVSKLTAMVQKDYATGHDILTRAWTELNNYSVLDRMNKDERTFNAFVDEDIEDENEAWKWRGTRSKARNQGIAMHANLTAAYIIPLFLAQNENDEIDRDFSDFMQDIVEWMTLNSEYQSSFLTLVFGMLTDPVVYLGAEYMEVFQTIRERQADGSATTTEILDEVLSGFQAPVYTADQILITNAYERNIQKQRSVKKRKWIEYSEAEAKYGEHPNWDFVQPGQNTVYNSDDGLFYDVKDDNHPNLVEEVTSMYRREDNEVCFLGGIYMGNDDVDANPFHHRDNRDAPKYNVTPFGYNRIGSHFFFYKSLMNVLGWDNALYDAMSELTMNRALLDVEMPVAVSGSDKVDSDMVFPGAVVAFEDKETKITPLLPQSRMDSGFAALNLTGSSMEEGSAISDVSSGQLPPKGTLAYNVAQAQAGAKKIISAVGKSLGESVAQYGLLMADIAIQHLSIPQVDEITDGVVKLKYRSFLLENKTVNGKRMNKVLRFDESMLGAEMTPEEEREKNLSLAKEAGYPEPTKAIYLMNPSIFAKMKYMTRADYKELFNQNEEFMQAMLTNLYMTIGQDPLINREALLRKLLYSYFRSGGDELINKAPTGQVPGLPAGPAVAGAAPAAPAGAQAMNTALSTAIGGGAPQ